jgi:hypothetical protein
MWRSYLTQNAMYVPDESSGNALDFFAKKFLCGIGVIRSGRYPPFRLKSTTASTYLVVLLIRLCLVYLVRLVKPNKPDKSQENQLPL